MGEMPANRCARRGRHGQRRRAGHRHGGLSDGLLRRRARHAGEGRIACHLRPLGFDRAVERGKLTRADADAAAARLTFTATVEELAAADLIIEAVPEQLALKVAVFRELDAATPPATILASNTSGFPIAALAAATSRPESVVGWHWASPAPVMRFAEIVRTRQTSPETSRRCAPSPPAVASARSSSGTGTRPGGSSRIASTGRCWPRRRVVDEGVASAEDVDQLMVDCFAWPVGPFAMIRGATTGW